MIMKNRMVHILMPSQEKADETRVELAGLDAQTSVIIHDRDTFKISGVSYEAVILEYETESTLWLEALARTLTSAPRTRVVLLAPELAAERRDARISVYANLFLAANLKQAAELALRQEELDQQDRKTILIVDDDNQVLKSFSRLLRHSPWNVYAVSHGERAMNLLNVEKVDLVVTDIKMPGIHGLELISRIRKNYKELPIVVCSGYPGMKDDMELKFYNIAGFIEKPVNPEEFEKQIAAALGE
ncbi:Protein with response regulator receiver domain [Desulfatibacillum aliphaticivorans]|uniref:Protein with response regulator receiver domain n=2 Tax=Desulfatibacillum aliphaticivorans TaxID=218208 RepID=B8FAK6_DESAL|nr:Protein with response regulator receiver domain [Desulfatibacillum aliphaticivorans]